MSMRSYREADRETYITLLMAKVQNVLLVRDLPNASLLVLAMNYNIDLDDIEFDCADKARIRSDLASEWIYGIARFFDELERVKSMRLPTEIRSAIDQMRTRYRDAKGTPTIRHEIVQELAARFSDYVFEVTPHPDLSDEIVVCVWPADEYLQRKTRKR